MFLRNRLLWAACLWVASASVWAAGAHDHGIGQAAPAAKATRTVEVVMQDMTFTPKALKVSAGETVRFVLINNGQLLHEFNLGDAAMHASHQQEMLKMLENGQLTPTAMKPMDHSAMSHADMAHGDMAEMKHDDPNSVLVEPGKRGELTWTFSQAGALEFACNIPGHYQAGMVGQLTVSP